MATARNARILDEAARRGSTPDGGIPTAAALLAAARGRSDDALENTTTSSASSPRCSRDATTHLSVAPANVDGGEHDGGDDDLALDAHHILLTMVRNGAESGHLGLLALEPLDDSAARRPRGLLSAPFRAITSGMWCASSAKSSPPPSCSPRSTFAGATPRVVVASRKHGGEDAEDVVVFSSSSSLRPLAAAGEASPSGVHPRRGASSRVRALRAVAIGILLPW